MTQTPTLRRGSDGPAVRALQVRLNALRFGHLLADGRFGPSTEAAVRSARRRLGLPPGVVADPALLEALGPQDAAS